MGGVGGGQSQGAHIGQDDGVHPRLSRYSSHSGRRATSLFRGMVLQVTWTRMPRRWQSSTASFSASGVKLPAKERMPKVVPAR